MMDGSVHAGGAPTGLPTVADAFGQIVWLLTRSPLHREMKLKDLEWSFLPPLVHEQFRIFRFGPLNGVEVEDLVEAPGVRLDPAALETMPLGVALWALLSEEAEAKLERNERLTPEEWRSGDRAWLVELISPYSRPDNKLSEAMLADLMAGPFKTRPFSLHRTDARTGRREKITLDVHLRGES